MLYTPVKTNVIPEESFENGIARVESVLSQYAEEGYMTSYDGARIAYTNYLVKDAVGSIVIVHGFTEYRKKYTELSWYFINKGYNVFTYDHRGHGFSDREVSGYELAHIESFDEYVFDLECFVDNIVIPRGGKENINIFSHSMGGSVTTLYLARCGDKISRAILSSPMVVPYTRNCPIWVLKIVLKTDARKNGWAGKFRYAGEFREDHPFDQSHDTSYPRFKHNLEVRIAEKRYHTSSSTNRWMYEAVTVGKRMLDKKNCGKVRAKMLIINSAEDVVVKRKPQEKLARRYNCSFISIPEAKHSAFICTSPKLEKYLNTIFDFLKA